MTREVVMPGRLYVDLMTGGRYVVDTLATTSTIHVVYRQIGSETKYVRSLVEFGEKFTELYPRSGKTTTNGTGEQEMRKMDEISVPTSCLNRAENDEPLFVLRANDELAPQIVRRWAEEYYRSKRGLGTTVKQIGKWSEAMRLADEMEEWRVARERRRVEAMRETLEERSSFTEEQYRRLRDGATIGDGGKIESCHGDPRVIGPFAGENPRVPHSRADGDDLHHYYTDDDGVDHLLADPPDKYCVTREDGDCVSDDPRCMHADGFSEARGALDADKTAAMRGLLDAAVEKEREPVRVCWDSETPDDLIRDADRVVIENDGNATFEYADGSKISLNPSRWRMMRLPSLARRES